jgi:hypothetical protein
MILRLALLTVLMLGRAVPAAQGDEPPRIAAPFLESAPLIDADLAEWKALAFTDGIWDIHRLKHTSWFRPQANRLTDHGDEPTPGEDLQARYYLAWDEKYLYLGAEVQDNVNDVHDPKPEANRWYFMDCVAWFIEAPRDTTNERFGQGDHAFCFVIDARMPAYGAWWRYGTPDLNYQEESLPAEAVDYQIRMDPWGRGLGDFILEARVDMGLTLGQTDPDWKPLQIGDTYSVEIVHTDPDGGNYGGHFILYGTGDDDATWGEMTLTGPLKPLKRLER